MTVAIAAFFQQDDQFGEPLSGGRLYSYAGGTLTPLATYTDETGTTPNTNPVILDSAGRADVWLTANAPYKLVLKDADDVEVKTIDNYYAGASPEQLQVAGIVPATGGTYSGPVSFAGGATFDGNSSQDWATIDSLGLAGRNLFINPMASIWQTNVGTIADGTYGFDQIVSLAQSGNVNLGQLGTVVDGIPYAMRTVQPDASAKRIGFCQPVEVENCIPYRGRPLMFQAKVRVSVSTTVRCALVSWNGTVNSPPPDPINSWTSTSYTASNFFVANTTTIGVAATACAAGTWTDIFVSSTSPGGIIAPSNMNNLYMVVWTDSAVPQDFQLDASLFHAGMGTQPQQFTYTDAASEFAKCCRYYERGDAALIGYSTTGSQVLYRVPFTVRKMKVPTLTYVTGSSTNLNVADARDATPTSLSWYGEIATTGSFTHTGTWTASARL